MVVSKEKEKGLTEESERPILEFWDSEKGRRDPKRDISYSNNGYHNQF